MDVKSGANLWGLDLRMRPAIVEADKIWRSIGSTLVVTSARDGIHSAGSLHYYGYAVDFRTREWGIQWNDTKRALIVQRLRDALGPDFQVISHADHIHVELQAVLE